MTFLVGIDLLHVIGAVGVDDVESVVFIPPVRSSSSPSKVEECYCPANTTGLSCQVS